MKALSNFKLFFVAIIWSCAPPISYNPGKALVNGTPLNSIPKVDSLAAKAKITVFGPQKKKTSAALVISVIPKKAYKLDVKGPLGNQLAEFLWEKDSSWTLNAPDQNIFESGEGSMVSLNNFNLENVSIHYLLGFLWGELLEENLKCRSGGLKTLLCEDEKKKKFFINKKSGQLLRVQDKNNEMEYKNYGELSGYVLPQRVIFFQNGKRVLSLDVRKIKKNPKWKSSPFRLSLKF